MGILDTLLGAATQANAQNWPDDGTQPGGAPPPALIDSLTGLISGQQADGGLESLVQRFAQAGLGDAMASWIGRGENATVSGEQMRGALGDDFIAPLAGKLGIDPHLASQLVAQWLPRLIDTFTPNGQLPDPTQVKVDSGLLSAVAGALLKPRT
ncbi:YidB family protein [Variovorax sp. VNK109]|jgi:uncharacterized protein YidB (DUF937 family)|uniref:YidB family protein n=1 Tax=Variovorax sp. VNK109 TaxID=3400919 RepID=UPI003C1296C0